MTKYLINGIEEIFNELTKHLIKSESINTKVLHIDGTKIESRANKYSFRWRGSIVKFREKLYKKITKYLISLNDKYKFSNISFNVSEFTQANTYLRLKISSIMKQ